MTDIWKDNGCRPGKKKPYKAAGQNKDSFWKNSCGRRIIRKEKVMDL